MIPKHATFRTRAEAETASVDGVARLNASLLAKAVGALPADKQGLASTTPTVVGRIVSVEAIPAGALPSTAAAHSRVTWEVTSFDGKIARITSVVPTSSVTPSTKTTGTCAAVGNNFPTLQLSGSLPDQVQIIATGTGTMPASTRLQDPNTGKQYEVTAATPYAGGTTIVPIQEVSAGEDGEVTHGSTLLISSPPSNVIPVCQVMRMKASTCASNTVFVDSLGRHYLTQALGTIPSSAKLAGRSSTTVTFKRDVADGIASKTSLEAGAILSILSPVSGIMSSAEVATASSLTIPSGTPLKDLATGKTYKSTADVVVPDSLAAVVAFEADVASLSSDLDSTHVLSFVPTVSGVQTAANVVSASGAVLYPIDMVPQLVGSPVEVAGSIRAEIHGGEWSATLALTED